jgi:ribosome-associated protein
MIRINEQIVLADEEVEMSAIRAQGAGGQNVNKVSTAIHLRFDVMASSLPGEIKQRLLGSRDRRLTSEGVVVIKAQTHRSQEKNRNEALERLRQLIIGAAQKPKKRIPTRPGRAAKARRLDEKKRRSQVKKLRSRPVD